MANDARKRTSTSSVFHKREREKERERGRKLKKDFEKEYGRKIGIYIKQKPSRYMHQTLSIYLGQGIDINVVKYLGRI